MITTNAHTLRADASGVVPAMATGAARLQVVGLVALRTLAQTRPR